MDWTDWKLSDSGNYIYCEDDTGTELRLFTDCRYYSYGEYFAGKISGGTLADDSERAKEAVLEHRKKNNLRKDKAMDWTDWELTKGGCSVFCRDQEGIELNVRTTPFLSRNKICWEYTYGGSLIGRLEEHSYAEALEQARRYAEEHSPRKMFFRGGGIHGQLIEVTPGVWRFKLKYSGDNVKYEYVSDSVFYCWQDAEEAALKVTERLVVC